jgi:hypothetical protein
MTCGSQVNISFVHPGSYTTVHSTDFKIGAASAFTGSGTTFIIIIYSLSDRIMILEYSEIITHLKNIINKHEYDYNLFH